MHGNPWLRLLRREVEALARTRHGDHYVNEQQSRAELTRIDKEIRRLRAELAELEERRAKLRSGLRGRAGRDPLMSAPPLAAGLPWPHATTLIGSSARTIR
jgi:hypothetical protein